MRHSVSVQLERGIAGYRAALKSVLLAVILVGGVILNFASARADSGPLRGLAGKCVDVTGAISADVTPLVLWSCHGGFNQQWELRSDRTIRGLGGKCLDVAGGNMQDGTPLILWSCHGGPNQQWEVRTDGTIRGLGEKCLDVFGGKQEDGTPLILWSCHGKPNQQWSGGKGPSIREPIGRSDQPQKKTFLGEANPPSIILARPFNIMAIGDSMMWGQGLTDQNKFVTLVAESLKKQLGKPDVVKHLIAHSGAITYPKAGEEAKDRPRFPGEVPHDYPSIHYQITQLAPTKVQPTDVDLVLVNGCINNIGVTTIITPWTKQFILRDDTKAFCGAGMQNILTEVARTFPQAKVIVTGYYPIVSAGDPSAGEFSGSDPQELADLLRAYGILIPPIIGELAMKEYRDRAAVLSQVFAEESERALRLAVDKMNALPPPLGGNRFRYTRPKFENYNAFAGGLSWLWRIPTSAFDLLRSRTDNQDELFLSRSAECAAAKKASISEFDPKCFIASTGHPNRLGAQAYANAIARTASFFLEEWLTRFGLSRPAPEPVKEYKDDLIEVCPPGLDCSRK